MTMIPLPPELETALHAAAMEQGMTDAQFMIVALQEKLKLSPSNSLAARRAELFGSQKGKIWMSDDFDEPLDDFKEYMP